MESDLLIGMFWTKIGTPTGVAESGTIEEIDHFVSNGKTAMLYFSDRPIEPNRIDLKQLKRLKAFKQTTYKGLLVGSFKSLEDLKQTLSSDLINQVRQLKKNKPASRTNKLEREFQITELYQIHKRHKITADEYKKFRDEILGNKRKPNGSTVDPVQPGEVGPNGFRVGYTKVGDKVEWIPSEEYPGEKWPMLLRRNDNAIMKAYHEFWDKVWRNRHQLWLNRINSGKEHLTKEQGHMLEKAKKAASKIERKYGKRNLQLNDFDFGLLNGKLSALSWVLGSEWEESLDT